MKVRVKNSILPRPMGYLFTAWILRACRLISKGMSMTFSSSTEFMKAVTDCNWLAEFPEDRLNRIWSRLPRCSPETSAVLVRKKTGFFFAWISSRYYLKLLSPTSALLQKYHFSYSIPFVIRSLHITSLALTRWLKTWHGSKVNVPSRSCWSNSDRVRPDSRHMINATRPLSTDRRTARDSAINEQRVRNGVSHCAVMTFLQGSDEARPGSGTSTS